MSHHPHYTHKKYNNSIVTADLFFFFRAPPADLFLISKSYQFFLPNIPLIHIFSILSVINVFNTIKISVLSTYYIQGRTLETRDISVLK